MMSTPSRQYATDVTDVQWRRIEPLLPASTFGHRGIDARSQDRLSLGFVAFLFSWKTVYDYSLESTRGLAAGIGSLTQRERRLNRAPTPSAGVVDSQTIKTATQ